MGLIERLIRPLLDKPIDNVDAEQRHEEYLTLFKLMRARRLLTLRVAGDSQRYQTLLLEVNADDGYLLIDEPFPTDGLLKGCGDQTLIMEYEKDGFCTRIESRVEREVTEDGDTYFRLVWPRRIEQIQRRDQFRLQLTRDVSASTRLAGHDFLLDAYLLDISATGIRFSASGNQKDTLFAGAYLQGLQLFLGSTAIECNLEITHCHYVDGSAEQAQRNVLETVAGGRLIGLSERDKKAIERFIFSAQRQMRREQLDKEALAA